MELSQRKLKILSSIIDIYIASGDPVGSKMIAEEIGVSSATIRNEMADLIEMGYLLQPHTSAGRIPSERGFREYLNVQSFESDIPERIRNSIDAYICSGAYSKDELIKRTAESLNEETNYLTVITKPDCTKAVITAVQFVQISRRTAMLILITSEGALETKVFHCDYDLNHDIMRIFFRIFNERVTGKKITDITRAYIQGLAISLGDMITLVSPALISFYEAAASARKVGTVLSGQLSLLSYPEFTSSDIKNINDCFKTPFKLNTNENLKQGKTSILLGSETGKEELNEAAVISAPYEVKGIIQGTISVIGPMRMDFKRTVTIVNHAAKTLSNMLTELVKEI